MEIDQYPQNNVNAYLVILLVVLLFFIYRAVRVRVRVRTRRVVGSIDDYVNLQHQSTVRAKKQYSELEELNYLM